MKIVIDACVLYPTVMREVVLAVAKAGLFTPLWSERLLEEWARAAAKLGPGQETLARGEIALTRANWPMAVVPADPDLVERLYLPDPDDRHVLAAAFTSGAEMILTLNLRDFPRALLSEHSTRAEHPDGFLKRMARERRDLVAPAVEAVRAEAERLSGQPQPMRALMKKARLPGLGAVLG